MINQPHLRELDGLAVAQHYMYVAGSGSDRSMFTVYDFN
jgi:hypothetical protein